MGEWMPIETAEHDTLLLLGWWQSDGHGAFDWFTEVGKASFGWSRGSISNIRKHEQATHWTHIPKPPRWTGRAREIAPTQEKENGNG